MLLPICWLRSMAVLSWFVVRVGDDNTGLGKSTGRANALVALRVLVSVGHERRCDPFERSRKKWHNSPVKRPDRVHG